MAPEDTSGATDSSISGRLSAALDDLRKAAEDAGGEVRTRIEDATQQIREASAAATDRAQETASAVSERAEDVRAQIESFRDWIQTATADLLDEVQREIDKRRDQLMGGGGGSGAA
jgi:F0F1-type ATP synthase membrane subunit b/b'